MRYLIIAILFLSFTSNVSADTISLTQEQFENLDKIDSVLKKKYPKFKGFNGSMDSLEIIGLPNAAVQDEIRKIDFNKIELDKEQEITDRQAAIDKLKTATGLTDKEIKLLGLGG